MLLFLTGVGWLNDYSCLAGLNYCEGIKIGGWVGYWCIALKIAEFFSAESVTIK